MSEKPGEYVGADGRTYRWGKYTTVGKDFYEVQCWNDSAVEPHWYNASISAPDLPAAKDALDALVDAEEGEWVYVTQRWRFDGGDRWQYCQNPGLTAWYDLLPAPIVIDAYRAGLATGKKDAQGLAEAVLEMGEQVWWNNQNGWDRIRALAESVQP